MDVDAIETDEFIVLRGNTKPHRHWIKFKKGKWFPELLEWRIPRKEASLGEVLTEIEHCNDALKEQHARRARKGWRRRKEASDPEQKRMRQEHYDAYVATVPQARMFVHGPEDRCTCKAFIFRVPRDKQVSGCDACMRTFDD